MHIFVKNVPGTGYKLNDLLTNKQTNKQTNSMDQSLSLEANKFTATQEIPHILWNQKFYYCIHKSAPPVSILSQINLVHASIPLTEDPF